MASMIRNCERKDITTYDTFISTDFRKNRGRCGNEQIAVERFSMKF